jgi:nickel transport protein
VQGKAILGEARFRDGTPMRSARVTVLDPAGAKLGETKTDREGKFTFEPRCRCDHRFLVDGGDGHAAHYTVRGEELPRHLAAAGTASAMPGEIATASPSRPADRAAGAKQPEPDATRVADSIAYSAELRGELEAIQAQLVQLRRELAAREDSTRWRDVLGGIGYILGLAGLAFYFLGARRRGEGRAMGGEGRGTRDEG